MLLAGSTFLLGLLLGRYFPASGTSGWQMLVWGFFISTVLLYHGTFTVNSVAHLFGSRRFETEDNSRNNLLVALITIGQLLVSGDAQQAIVEIVKNLTVIVPDVPTVSGG